MLLLRKEISRSYRFFTNSFVKSRVFFISQQSYASLLKAPDFKLIEPKWIKRWKDQKNSSQFRELIESNGKAEKFYVLSMFPYPSGMLHMGHVRVYTISDTIARFRKMCGYEVIHPMGWDAFGLPAENAAIERGINPAEWTIKNIKTMKDQMEKMLTDFDWEREITTCNPEYYKWTQYLFLQLYKHGLAYRKEAVVNWDPVDQTVLANEQVDAEGRSWRSGAIVEHRKLKQWFFKITDYAELLLKDLDLLNQWPDNVKTMQRNWIGKSEGAEFDFEVDLPGKSLKPVTVFTSRPDTIFGVHYLVISLDHPILGTDKIPKENQAKVYEFITNMKREQIFAENNAKTKQGVHTGLYAKHPFTGESLPIYVSPYVLSDYGTGAVMGVPGHDQRDWEFTIANSPIKESEIRHVVEPVETKEATNKKEFFTGHGILTAQSGPYKGLKSTDAMQKIVDDAQNLGFGRWVAQYRLRDWLLSRQRYWGTPIPMIHCHNCNVVPVPEQDLPVLLPKNITFSGRGESPLKQAQEWINCACPKCNGPATRDTDTMDTFVDSSWYYVRFTDPKNSKEPFSSDIASELLPIDLYVGGVEHAILHLLYARFFGKFMFNQNFCKADSKLGPGNGEPFKALLTQGMVHGKTYKDPSTGRFLKPDELDLSDADNPRQKSTGSRPAVTFEKMSKRKYNGVDPETLIDNYGADATRLHILFKAPVLDVLEWEETSIVGMQRWLNRVWRLVGTVIENSQQRLKTIKPETFDVSTMDARNKETYRLINLTIKEVTNALSQTYSLNTVVSDLTKLTNHLTAVLTPNQATSDSKILISPTFIYGVETLIKMLSPLAPSFGEECWEAIQITRGNNLATSGSIFKESWPQIDPAAFSVSQVTCAIQINGKTKFTISIPSKIVDNPQTIESLIRESPDGRKWLGDRNFDKKVKRVIHVGRGKLVNFVLER